MKLSDEQKFDLSFLDKNFEKSFSTMAGGMKKKKISKKSSKKTTKKSTKKTITKKKTKKTTKRSKTQKGGFEDFSLEQNFQEDFKTRIPAMSDKAVSGVQKIVGSSINTMNKFMSQLEHKFDQSVKAAENIKIGDQRLIHNGGAKKKKTKKSTSKKRRMKGGRFTSEHVSYIVKNFGFEDVSLLDNGDININCHDVNMIISPSSSSTLISPKVLITLKNPGLNDEVDEIEIGYLDNKLAQFKEMCDEYHQNTGNSSGNNMSEGGTKKKKTKKSSSKKTTKKKPTKKKTSKRKSMKGGDGSDFALTLNSRGPANYPDNGWFNGKQLFHTFTKTGEYIPNSRLPYAAAPISTLSNPNPNNIITGYDNLGQSWAPISN